MYQVGTHSDKKEPQVPKYENFGARYWTATDKGIATFYELRKQYAKEIQDLTQQQKAETEREMKKYYSQLIKDAKRWDKAANIWIDHFMKVGRKNMQNFPMELREQLNTIFWKAENAE